MRRTKQLDFNVKLHKKQEKAFYSTADEILYGGAAGGGKSYLLRVASIIWAMQIPKLQIYLFRRTLGEIKSSHVEGPTGYRELLRPFIDAGLAKVVEDQVRFPNGSRIHFSFLNVEEDKQKYLSTEMHVLLIDEVSTFTEPMYRFLRSRVRMTGVQVPDEWKGKFPRILMATNPGGIGHQWLKGGFIDGVEDQQIRQMPPEEGGRRRQFIRALIEDNHTMMREDPNYGASLEGLGSAALVAAMRHGDWNVVAGSFFPEFSEQEHVIKPFTIPKHWTKFAGADWGFAEPFAVVWAAVCPEAWEVRGIDGMPRVIPKDSLVFYREHYGMARKANGAWDYNKGVKITPAELAIQIKELEAGETLEYRVLDPAAFAHRSGPSEAETMRLKGVSFRRADNTRIPKQGNRGGWLHLRERLRGDDGKPKIYFFENCEHTIRTFPSQQHDPKKPEDMVTKDVEDHLMDAVRYAVMSRPWAGKVPTEEKEIEWRNPTLGELTDWAVKRASERNVERI